MLDAHGSTGVAEAIKLARAVEEYDMSWYEEPVISHNFEGLAEVRRATSVPVATGENLFTRFHFRDLALARARRHLAAGRGDHRRTDRDAADRRPRVNLRVPARAPRLGQRLPLGRQPPARRRDPELLYLRVRPSLQPAAL